MRVFKKLKQIYNDAKSVLETDQYDLLLKNILNQVQYLENLSKKKEYQERTLKIVTENMRYLLSLRVEHEDISRFLCTIGNGFNLCAVRIFQLDGYVLYPFNSWFCSDFDHVNNKVVNTVNLKQFPRWQTFFKNGQSICGTIDEFPEEEAAIMRSSNKINFKSVCSVPIKLIDGSFFGILSMADYTMERKWTREEKNVIETAAILLGTSLYLNPKLWSDE